MNDALGKLIPSGDAANMADNREGNREVLAPTLGLAQQPYPIPLCPLCPPEEAQPIGRDPFGEPCTIGGVECCRFCWEAAQNGLENVFGETLSGYLNSLETE